MINDNPSIMIYVNKIKNRLTCKIKTVYYLKRLMPETMKKLGSTKSKITKNKHVKNVFCLEITEVVVIYCNILNNYQQDSK